jgi:hypothetical protein
MFELSTSCLKGRDQEAHGSAVREAQVVEYLPSKPKALSSSPGTTKKERKKRCFAQPGASGSYP